MNEWMNKWTCASRWWTGEKWLIMFYSSAAKRLNVHSVVSPHQLFLSALQSENLFFFTFCYHGNEPSTWNQDLRVSLSVCWTRTLLLVFFCFQKTDDSVRLRNPRRRHDQPLSSLHEAHVRRHHQTFTLTSESDTWCIMGAVVVCN